MFISMLSFSVYRGGEPSKSQINYAGLFPLLLYFLAKVDFLQSPETIRKKKKGRWEISGSVQKIDAYFLCFHSREEEVLLDWSV